MQIRHRRLRTIIMEISGFIIALIIFVALGAIVWIISKGNLLAVGIFYVALFWLWNGIKFLILRR